MAELIFRPIEQRPQLSEAIYQAIEESIVKGLLKPGQHLALAELAEYFNTSVTPVREACARLEKAGLLVKVPNRGWQVRSFSPDEIVELYETRAALESFAAWLCCDRIDEDGVERLVALQQKGRRLLDASDLEGYSRYNEELHALIVDLTKNQTLKDTVSTIYHRVRLCMTRTVAVRGRPEKAIQEHEALVRAIAKRQRDTAAMVMREHILGAVADVVSELEKARN